MQSLGLEVLPDWLVVAARENCNICVVVLVSGLWGRKQRSTKKRLSGFGGEDGANQPYSRMSKPLSLHESGCWCSTDASMALYVFFAAEDAPKTHAKNDCWSRTGSADAISPCSVANVTMQPAALSSDHGTATSVGSLPWLATKITTFGGATGIMCGLVGILCLSSS